MISLNLQVAVQLPRAPTRDIERDLARSVRMGAEYVRSVWMSAVSGTVLPGMRGPVDDPTYLRSLGMPSAVRRGGQYEYVVTADYERVVVVEQGFPAFDMKPMLLGGAKARRSKDGRRYNIIPFRFGTPQPGGGSRAHFPGDQTMPGSIYDIVSLGEDYPSGDTEGMRTKLDQLLNTYGEPGGVNAQALIRGLSGPMDAPYTWKSGLYAGMRQVGSPTQRRYYTFRTVSDPDVVWRRVQRPDGRIVSSRVVRKGSDPNSWIHPGRAANPVMQAVVDYSRPTVERAIGNAVSVAFG